MTDISTQAGGNSVAQNDTSVTRNSLAARFQIDNWTVEPALNRMHRDKEKVHFEPKVMDVLVYLAERPGSLVTRQELDEAIWPNMIVGYDALTSAIQKLRKAFDDNPRKPHVIETLSKKGYRLIAAVEHLQEIDSTNEGIVSDQHENDRLSDSFDEKPSVSTHSLEGKRKSRMWITASAVFLFGMVLLLGVFRSDQTTVKAPVPEETVSAQKEQPVLAVLPLLNQSEDPKQEYFIDGITEDLITDLSRISGLGVISRNSMFGYKGTAPEPQEVAMQIGASHVLEGSIRKVANEVRINVTLIDASSGVSVWADRFDGNLQDVFKFQDRVTQDIVSALALKLTEEEQYVLTRERRTSIEAQGLYFMGRAYYSSASKQQNEESRENYRRAIEMDPNYAQAYAAIALTYLDDWRRRWVDNPHEAAVKAIRYAQQAIDVDDSNPQAHFAQGYIYLYAKGEHDRAIESAKAALALDPNYANGYALLSSAYFFSGYPDLALPLDLKAKQLDPGNSNLYLVHLGRSYYFQGKYQEALDAFMQSEERNYNYMPNHLWLALTYQKLDQPEDAEWEIDKVLTLDPDFSIQYWMKTRPYKNPEHRAQLFEGLSELGLPE